MILESCILLSLAVTPTTRPASAPASQPATRPAATRPSDDVLSAMRMHRVEVGMAIGQAKQAMQGAKETHSFPGGGVIQYKWEFYKAVPLNGSNNDEAVSDAQMAQNLRVQRQASKAGNAGHMSNGSPKKGTKPVTRQKLIRQVIADFERGKAVRVSDNTP